MIFEDYARDWFHRQEYVKGERAENKLALDACILPVIGPLELKDISEKKIDEIFVNEKLLRRKDVFTDRVFRILCRIFDELMEKHLISKDPVLHIYSPVVLVNEKAILDCQRDVVLTGKSPFSQVSCMWLKNQNYKPVTYNLYFHFLTHFIHPFIGRKSIGLINHNNIKNIYTYFNTVATNETWIGQIHLVMRMVFDYALEKKLISNNPMLKINDPHFKPIIDLDREKRNAVRAAFNMYGFRKNRIKNLSHELFNIMSTEEEYHNRTGIPKNSITFAEVYEKWFAYTQEGVLSVNTSGSSAHSMGIYMLPNIGSKPIQEVSPADLSAILDVFALMGNTADYYIIAKLRSLFEYAAGKGYVSDNIARDLKSANNRTAEKLILSDEEIKTFLHICDESDSIYGCLLGLLLCTGLRISEGLAVSNNNWDRELNTLRITNQIMKRSLIAATKTRRGRKIRLSGTAIFFLNKAKGLQDVYALDPEYNNELGLIFTTAKGRPLSHSRVFEKIYEIAFSMGRPDITAHTLRHTYMTVSSRCGENLDDIQSEVGHGFSSDVITEYLHNTEESRHESAIRRQEYLERIMERFQDDGE